MNLRSKELILTLLPELQDLAKAMLLKCDMYLVTIPEKAGEFSWCKSTMEITSAKRDLYLQCGLYTQGRHWNALERHWEVLDEGAIVTRTLESKHLQGKAFDIAPIYNGGYLWSKFDPGNDYNKSIWLHLAEIGESLGLKAGARFIDKITGKPKPDYPHFEIP